MFKTIVLGLDGSEGSEPAMALASQLAKGENGRIVVVHVEEDVVGKGGGPINASEEEVQAEIRKRAEQLSDQGIETEVKMKSTMLGGPAHPLAEIADEENADLIVVGTRGHSPIAGLLLGSVTQRLLHLAKQPVLVAPSSSHK